MTIEEIKKQAIKSARKVKKEDVEEAINFFKEEQTAKEMFEKIGYEKVDSRVDIAYIKRNDNDQDMVSHIKFIRLPGKKFIVSTFDCYAEKTYYVKGIYSEELQAINQQCKELKWID